MIAQSPATLLDELSFYPIKSKCNLLLSLCPLDTHPSFYCCQQSVTIHLYSNTLVINSKISFRNSKPVHSNASDICKKKVYPNIPKKTLWIQVTCYEKISNSNDNNTKHEPHGIIMALGTRNKHHLSLVNQRF